MNKLYKGIVRLDSDEQFQELMAVGSVTLASGELVSYSPDDTTYYTPGNKYVSYKAQQLEEAEKKQARANIGIDLDTIATKNDLDAKVGFKYTQLKNADTDSEKEDVIITNDVDATIAMYHQNGTTQSGINARKNYTELSSIFQSAETTDIAYSRVSVISDSINLISQNGADNKSKLTITPTEVVFDKNPSIQVGEEKKKLYSENDKVLLYSEQTLTDSEKTQAKTNLGITDIDTSKFVTTDTDQTITGVKTFEHIKFDKSTFISNNMSSNSYVVAVGNYLSVYGDHALTIGDGSAAGYYATGLGGHARGQYSLAVGTSLNSAEGTDATGLRSIAIGSIKKEGSKYTYTIASADDAIQIGVGTNANVKTLQIWDYQLLDGNTGKIPVDRLPSNIIQQYLELSGEDGVLTDDQYALVTTYDNLIITRSGVDYRLQSKPLDNVGDYQYESTYYSDTTKDFASYNIIVKTDKTWKYILKPFSGSPSSAVLYTAQALTQEQKEQACQNIGVSCYITISDQPESATNGTLSEEQLAVLQSSNNSYILFNNEKFILQDIQTAKGYLVFTHVGEDAINKFFTKCIAVTISTRAWTLKSQSVDTALIENSTNLITSGGVYAANELKADINAENINYNSFATKLNINQSTEVTDDGSTVIRFGNLMFICKAFLITGNTEQSYTFPYQFTNGSPMCWCNSAAAGNSSSNSCAVTESSSSSMKVRVCGIDSSVTMFALGWVAN